MQILYPILSAIFFAFVGFFTKVLVTKTEKPIVSAALFNIFAGLLFIPFFIFEKPQGEISSASLFLLFASVIAYTACSMLNFESSKYLDVSISGVLSQITLVFSFVGSILIFHENVTIQKLLGVGLILFGNIFLFVKKNKSVKISGIGVFLRVLTAVTLAIALLIDAKNSVRFSISLYAFILYLFPGLLMFLYSRANLKEAKTELLNNKLGFLLISMSGTISYYFLIKAFAEVDKTIVVPINNTYTIILVLMGIAFLKERSDILRKIIASLIVFAGVVVLGLA